MVTSHAVSFRGLVSLQTLDLSRNRLGSAPAEAFSYLSWLSNLNLDLNSWNCSCQLVQLAAFLSTYIQHPDKVQKKPDLQVDSTSPNDHQMNFPYCNYQCCPLRPFTTVGGWCV